MEYIQLNDGNELPLIGFGTYKATGDLGIQSVTKALELGYRLFDSAAIYDNEKSVGTAIRESAVPRAQIKLTTKLWRSNLGYTAAKHEFENSLKKLHLDYVDFYLIHWPANVKNYNNWQEINAETWRALEELQAEGKVKSIGVSNFLVTHLEALLETAKVIPAVNQIEFHPGYWQPETTRFCQQNTIAVQAWQPLAKGLVFENKILTKLAEKYQKSVAQICLRWIVQHKVCAIPKSSTPSRIAENIAVFDFNLSKDEMQQIDQIPKQAFSGYAPDGW